MGLPLVILNRSGRARRRLGGCVVHDRRERIAADDGVRVGGDDTRVDNRIEALVVESVVAQDPEAMGRGGEEGENGSELGEHRGHETRVGGNTGRDQRKVGESRTMARLRAGSGMDPAPESAGFHIFCGRAEFEIRIRFIWLTMGPVVSSALSRSTPASASLLPAILQFSFVLGSASRKFL
jgi:hypothetical protein